MNLFIRGALFAEIAAAMSAGSPQGICLQCHPEPACSHLVFGGSAVVIRNQSIDVKGKTGNRVARAAQETHRERSCERRDSTESEREKEKERKR